jgi:hypothetical protein
MSENRLASRRPIDYFVLWGVALLSLGINLYLVNALLEARRQAAQAALTAAAAVEQLRASAIDYNVAIQQTLPVSLTVSYRQTLSVPISTTLPVNTNVSVPLNTPIGNFPINFPVNATIPVSLNPQIPLSLAVPISTTVPVSLAVPIHIALGDTGFGPALTNAEQYLNNLATSLAGAQATPAP